jgi:hypothetical protein
LLPLGFASAEDIEEIREKNLIVNIDDPLGFFDIDAEWIREDLLENAFYEAAARQKLKDFELTYNDVTPKNARGVLEFRIISWRRSVANMYEFTTAARYLNADGDEIKLGVFRGYRSGIDVFIGRDIGDHFADTAEDAFRQALKKLEEKLS